jgi:ABC-type uncharacterized transport system substrate-binding protein
MTKRDEEVFAKAFEKMETKGYFTELRAKAKTKPKPKANTKPKALKVTKKTHQRTVADSVSSARSTLKVSLVANKR